MSEPEPAACEQAMSVLLHGIAEHQRGHARRFLLRDLESIHLSAGSSVPAWIGVLRRGNS